MKALKSDATAATAFGVAVILALMFSAYVGSYARLVRRDAANPAAYPPLAGCGVQVREVLKARRTQFREPKYALAHDYVHILYYPVYAVDCQVRREYWTAGPDADFEELIDLIQTTVHASSR